MTEVFSCGDCLVLLTIHEVRVTRLYSVIVTVVFRSVQALKLHHYNYVYMCMSLLHWIFSSLCKVALCVGLKLTLNQCTQIKVFVHSLCVYYFSVVITFKVITN